MSKITSESVIDCIKKGGNALYDLVRDVYVDGENRAFADAIEIGIQNTISALYEAKVSDESIIGLMNKYWGISMAETEERLISEKSHRAIRELKHYLKMQGYSESEIQHFMVSTRAGIKIKHDRDLWKLFDNPEKLFNIVQGN